ncbi:MAG: porin [Methylophilaceae bacterium]|nr:porin [Methylophilaceae bacterium]
MNTKITAAVASAALVLGATTANAGIIIPAGEWTLDVNGNVNVYVTMHSADDSNAIAGGTTPTEDATGEGDSQSINTGLLPAWLGFTGTTRQNDLDVSFTISMQPNVSQNDVMGDSGVPNDGVAWRQAFLTFGDASWGTVKMGKDIGIFSKNAILSDMTLLGVGAIQSPRSGGNFTGGGIGTGYIYPAWKGQVAYTSPNMNGFQFTVGVTNPNQSADAAQQVTNQDRLGLEAALDFSFENGKIWTSGASYEVDCGTGCSYDATAVDVGINYNLGNLGLTAYAYTADGAGTTFFHNGAHNSGDERESDGGYVQATYVIPSGTKLGVSYGISNLDKAGGEADSALVEENNRLTVGAYHPLTKHLNLVAEFNKMESESHNGLKNEADSVSLGAILFF